MIVVVGRVQTDADSIENENAFVFVEEWESEGALRQHFATPHIAEFMSAIPEVLVAEPDVNFHTIAGSMTLADISRR